MTITVLLQSLMVLLQSGNISIVSDSGWHTVRHHQYSSMTHCASSILRFIVRLRPDFSALYQGTTLQSSNAITVCIKFITPLTNLDDCIVVYGDRTKCLLIWLNWGPMVAAVDIQQPKAASVLLYGILLVESLTWKWFVGNLGSTQKSFFAAFYETAVSVSSGFHSSFSLSLSHLSPEVTSVPR